jgi:chromosome condensin MukBEF ATPase and DNA-binding subunit MukB
LKFHFGTSSWGGTRKLPRAFTEQGVAILSSVPRSKRAVSVNIEIMRAFVRMRQMLATNATLERRLNELEKKYDAQFEVAFNHFHWSRNASSERGGFSAGLSKNGVRSQMFWRHRHGH